ncbi:MAG: hypothetical protein B7Z55_18190, partial [Planctomycetales bacterium 12-60-4]
FCRDPTGSAASSAQHVPRSAPFRVAAKLYELQFESQNSSPGKWEFWFSAQSRRGLLGSEQAGIGNSFYAELPLDHTRFAAKGEGVGNSYVPDMGDGLEHQVWEYTSHWMESIPDGPEHQFRYRLSVRMAPVTTEDKLGSAQPVGGDQWLLKRDLDT